MTNSQVISVNTWQPDGASRGDDCIAAEIPIALTYNRVSHVVMMATPADLEDFGLGFSLTEGIIGAADDLLATRIVQRDGGIELAMTIAEPWFDRLATQRRNLTGRTGCGLCGAERIEQALRYPDPVADDLRISHAALQRALRSMPGRQVLQSETGATHAAAWCSADGEIVLLREDVGRHNALDKLAGALFRRLRDGTPIDATAGFVVVSSRASYEMVYKTATIGVQLMAAVSAPTTLAIEFAQRCGLTLVGFARADRHNIYTFPQRLLD